MGNLDSVAGLVASITAAGVVTAWNRGAERITGYEAAVAVGKSWWGFCPVDFHARAAEQAMALRDEGALSCTQAFRHAGGRVLWLEMMFLATGDPREGYLVVGREVARDRAGTDGWRGLVEGSSDGVVAVDEAGRVVVCNGALERLLGIERGGVMGGMLAATPVLHALFREISERSGGRAVEVMGRRLDGVVLPLTGVGGVVEIGGRRLAFVTLRGPVAAGREGRMEAASFQADKNRAISLLARGVAHDFNNIFAAILSHLDLMRTAPGLGAELRGNVELAQASARRGAELVGKLQTFSSHAEPRLQVMDLGRWVGEEFALVRRSIGGEVGVRLVPPAEDLWAVRGDANQVLQLLVNLCLTVREAVPRGGEIVVRIENVPGKQPLPGGGAAGDHVVLAVAGLGVGRSVAELGAWRSRAGDGMDGAMSGGLGLSIADNLCAKQGGWLEVERRAGVGTEFRVFLPRAERVAGAAAAVAVAEELPAAASLDGTETILVVDDEQPLRMLMRAVLSYRGYQIIEAESGEDSLLKYAAAKGVVRLVLMDVHLPGMSGWAAMAKLKEMNPQLPVVVMSGGFVEEESRRAKVLGAANFVAKPFDNRELVRAVRRGLDGAEAGAVSGGNP